MGGGDRAGEEEEESFALIWFSFSSMEGLWDASGAAAAVLGRGTEEAISDLSVFQREEKRSGSRAGGSRRDSMGDFEWQRTKREKKT